MKASKRLKGTGVALVTPFHKDGSINFKGFRKLIDHVIGGKADYLVPLGTTGESVTLSKDEKTAIFDFVIETVNKRVPVVAGIGGNSTSDVIKCINEMDLSGFDAILSVTPYYNKPTQRGLYQHYRMIANEAPVPVILYNVPGRTGVNMLPETTLSIANDFENVIGVKEASGNIEQIMAIIKSRPEGFLVISGDDLITLPLIAAGADGVISVVANAFPKEYSDMTRYSMKGQFEKARELHYLLADIIPMLFAEGSPPGIKAVLNMMGVCEDFMRLPLVNVSKGHYNRLAAALEAIRSNQ
jgi:4-hydroxy-tetrahydrodipicolinate synthase